MGVVMTALGFAVASMAPTYDISLLGVQVSLFCVGIAYAVGATVLGNVTPPAMMGRVSAVYLLIQGLSGQSLGPVTVALVAKGFAGSHATLSALALTAVVLAIAALLSLAFLRNALRLGQFKPATSAASAAG